MTYKENDFVKIEFDVFANGKLVQTTDKKKADEAKLELKTLGAKTIVLGKNFILKALDDDIIKNNKTENTLELKPEEAYGKRKKEYIKTFPKSAFDEQKMRAIPGMAYDFNGNMGTVKTVIGGRVRVDFNNPLAGRDISLSYKIVGKVEDLKEKLELVLVTILRLSKQNFKLNIKEKVVTLDGPAQLMALKEQLKMTFEEFVPEFKDYSLEIQTFKKE